MRYKPKKIKINCIWIALAIVIILGTLVLSGCSTSKSNNNNNDNNNAAPSGNPPDARQRPNGRMNNMMNLTEEERQQMMEARTKMAASACEGKTEGDNCIIQISQIPRGNMTRMNTTGRNMTGTCKTQNETLLCSIEMGTPPGQRPNN